MAMPSHNCVIINASDSVLWSDPAMPESLLRGIAANPGKVIRAAACRPVKIGHGSLIVEATLTIGDRSMPVAVKQYRPRTFWKALAASFRPAKAMQNWRKAEFLLSYDIATPRPLLACRPRGWTTRSTSFLATEWIRGRTVDDALAIRNTDIVKELSLPPVKIHCSVLAEDAIRAAIGDWRKKNGVADAAPGAAAK